MARYNCCLRKIKLAVEEKQHCWKDVMSVSNRARAREFIKVMATDKIEAKIIDSNNDKVIYTSEDNTKEEKC